ncbi:MAG: hypothetical protein E6I97_26955 [Chloroflexi bacterium]|nr:MAG: hypothetical protein E6I97_26955 [Chloroflexota bacterium]
MTVLVEMSGSAASLQVDRKGQPYYIRPCHPTPDAAHRTVYSRVDPCGQPWGLGVGQADRVEARYCCQGRLAVNLGGWARVRLQLPEVGANRRSLVVCWSLTHEFGIHFL